MESQDTTQNENDGKNFSFRDGTLFIIDTSPEMFEKDDSEKSYFAQCLNVYGRILSQKLTWNRRDWMGLILYNTKLRDDSQVEDIQTVQKFEEVTTEMLVNTLYICENMEDHYKKNAVSSDTSLHDVLWHACRAFDSVKVTMTPRRVILLTRRDNPLPDDEANRHKIRLRAKTYRDVNVKLQVVGLGADWNHELFYKDIHVLANDANPEDVKRIKLEDLEIQIRFPARASGHMKLEIGNDLKLPVFISSFSGKTKYLKQARMDPDTNEVLDVVRHWGPSRQFGDYSEDEDDDEIIKTRVPDNIRKGMKFGENFIWFQPREIREIRISRKPGINLIGFQPIRSDLVHHIKATKFVGIEDSASREEKMFFAALLNECETKTLMAICSVSHRSAPYLAKMIPCSQYGGFYLYKNAFKEQINDLGEYTKPYLYSELPTTQDGIALMKRIVKRLTLHFDRYKFTNPKLAAQLAYVEALVLDREVTNPGDSTLPNQSVYESRLSRYMDRYNEQFPATPSSSAPKRAAPLLNDEELRKVVKFDSDVIEDLVKKRELHRVLAVTLKCFARTLNISTNGSKAELIERITDYFA